MKTRLSTLLMLAGLCVPLRADPMKPVIDNPEGLRAYNDLAAYYAKWPGVAFDIPPEIADVNSTEQAKAQKAGEYLLALFEQSWADESDGRTTWRPLPFFGGDSDNPARNARQNLAEAFGKSAASPAALPAALWLIENDLVEDDIHAGADALARIHGATADAAIEALLREQHPSEKVLVMALQEAGARGLIKEKESVIALEQSYRPAVRAAAQAAVLKLGEKSVQTYDRSAPLSPRIVEFLETNAQRIVVPAPKDAKWVKLSLVSRPAARSLEVWILHETDCKLDLLDIFGSETSWNKRLYQLEPTTLKATAEKLISLRAEIVALLASAEKNPMDGHQAWEKLGAFSRVGTLSSQFEPDFISLPEITVAVWCWQRGDLITVAVCWSNVTARLRMIDGLIGPRGTILAMSTIKKWCRNFATTRMTQLLCGWRNIFPGPSSMVTAFKSGRRNWLRS